MIIAIVQARLTSSRLPKKVFLKYNGITVLEHIYSRLNQSKHLDKIVFAVPSNKNNLTLRNFLKKKNIPFIVGPEINVLKRFYKICNIINPKIVIRVTSDCPLIDFKLMDSMIEKFLNKKSFDFLSNSITRTYPDGLDIEIFKKKVLINTYKKAKKNFDKEHVTPYMIRNFKCFEYKNKIDLSYKRWTLDTQEDHKRIKKIFNKFKKKQFFSWKEILSHGF